MKRIAAVVVTAAMVVFSPGLPCCQVVAQVETVRAAARVSPVIVGVGAQVVPAGQLRVGSIGGASIGRTVMPVALMPTLPFAGARQDAVILNKGNLTLPRPAASQRIDASGAVLSPADARQAARTEVAGMGKAVEKIKGGLTSDVAAEGASSTGRRVAEQVRMEGAARVRPDAVETFGFPDRILYARTYSQFGPVRSRVSGEPKRSTVDTIKAVLRGNDGRVKPGAVVALGSFFLGNVIGFLVSPSAAIMATAAIGGVVAVFLAARFAGAPNRVRGWQKRGDGPGNSDLQFSAGSAIALLGLVSLGIGLGGVAAALIPTAAKVAFTTVGGGAMLGGGLMVGSIIGQSPDQSYSWYDRYTGQYETQASKIKKSLQLALSHPIAAAIKQNLPENPLYKVTSSSPYYARTTGDDPERSGEEIAVILDDWMLRNLSPQFIAAKMAAMWTRHLLKDKLPESAEKTYAENSMFVRIFIDLTRSTWNQWRGDFDHFINGNFQTYRHAFWWRQGFGFDNVRQGAYFKDKIMRSEGDPGVFTVDGRGRQTLFQRAQAGQISDSKATAAQGEFDRFVQNERQWLQNHP